MRKRLSVILVVVGLMVLMTSSVVKAMGIGVGGTLGYVSMNMGDLKDWNQDLKDSAEDAGLIVTMDAFKSDISYGADGKVSFGENFGLRLGYSHLSGEQAVEASEIFIAEKYIQQVSASAITGSLIFAMPLSSFSIYAGAGLGYYLAKIISTDELTIFGTTTTIREVGKGNAIGFHGFLGGEYFLSKNFSLSLEALYRVAKIPSLTCTENTIDPSNVGNPIKRGVYDKDTHSWGPLKDLELDFGGFNILAALHLHF